MAATKLTRFTKNCQCRFLANAVPKRHIPSEGPARRGMGLDYLISVMDETSIGKAFAFSDTGYFEMVRWLEKHRRGLRHSLLEVRIKCSNGSFPILLCDAEEGCGPADAWHLNMTGEAIAGRRRRR